MSDSQAETVTISVTDAGFWGTGVAFDKPLFATSLEELADLALSLRHAAGVSALPRWKVAPWSLDTGYTRISTEVLLDLLRLPGGRTNVDIAQCHFGSCDLSTSNMDRLNVEGDIRWLGENGLDLGNTNMASVPSMVPTCRDAASQVPT